MKKRAAMPAAPRIGAAVIMAAPPVDEAVAALAALEAALAADEALLAAADAAELATDSADLERLAATALAEASIELISEDTDEATEAAEPESEL